MSDDTAFTVYWRRVGKKRWHEALSQSLEAASLQAREHDDGDHHVLLYENGVVISYDGARYEGNVLFWWNDSYSEEMECEPSGRGNGWSDELEDYVQYTSAFQEVTIASDERRSRGVHRADEDAPMEYRQHPIENSKHVARYAEVECYKCGKMVPQNEAIEDNLEIQSARVSGTSSFGVARSSRNGYSSRGLSHSDTYRTSSRRTSGRSVYRVERVFFCCEKHQFEAQSQAVQNKPALDKIAFYGAEFFKRLTRE